MIWNLIISLIMALISYLTTKRGDSRNNGKALAAAAVAGLGTNYLLSNTEWGQDSVAWLNSNIADLDGVVSNSNDSVDPTTGKVTTTTTNGGVTTTVPSTGKETNLWDTLSNWGATGTATVIGTTAVATDSGLRKYLPWLAIGLVGILILK